jgi:hypothetical protein
MPIPFRDIAQELQQVLLKVNPFFDVGRERDIPYERKQQRQRPRAKTKPETAEQTRSIASIVRKLRLFLLRLSVWLELELYNRTVYCGKCRVKNGDRTDIHWKGTAYRAARRSDAVWALCTPRKIEDEPPSNRGKTELPLAGKDWEPLLVVGIDRDEDAFIINEDSIALNRDDLVTHLKKLSPSQPLADGWLIWTDSKLLEVIGGVTLFAIIVEILNAVFAVDKDPLAKRVIAAGAFFTLAYLFDLGVYVGGLVGGGATIGLLSALAFDDPVVIGLGAGLGAAFAALTVFADVTILKSDDPKRSTILRKEDWLRPEFYGTRLSNCVLTPINITIGALKGAVVALLILAKYLPLLVGVGSLVTILLLAIEVLK